MSFVFYDVETTGLDWAFDQIVSFAAIKTDNDLKVIETFEIHCRLLPYIIPSPQAILVNRIDVNRLTDHGLPSYYEMACLIHKKLTEWSPSIFIGYNSLRFDENFLRQTFYQNLLPPYLTNTNNNTRADCMRMIQAAFLLMPDVINIPNISEKKRFNLKDLAEANGYTAKETHSALHDAYAIIHLCRLLCEKTPDVWSSSVRFSQKSSVLDFVQSEDVYCFCSYESGIPFSALVTTIGNNQKDSNELLAFNLSFDPDSLAAKQDEDLLHILKGNSKVLLTFRSNACPIIFPEYDAPGFAGARSLSCQELNRRVSRIKKDKNLSERLMNIYYSDRRDWEASPYVEKQIYNKYFDRDDENVIAQFHKIPWEFRHKLLESISDERLQELGLRIVHTERPETLSNSLCNQCNVAAAKRILGIGGEVPWLSVPKALDAIKALLAQSDFEDIKILSGLSGYLEKIGKQASDKLVQSSGGK